MVFLGDFITIFIKTGEVTTEVVAMDKQDNKLALSVLTTLISGIILILLIVYQFGIFAIAGISLLFLICAYILTLNIIAFTTAKNKAMKLQMKEYLDEISTQLETLSGTQSQLGKATYLYTKKAAQSVAALENNYVESQEALYKNLTSISNAQNKATKLMIKYDQSNTTKVISTIKELRSQLSDTMIQGFDQLQPDNSEIITALEDIVSYLKAQPTVPDQTLSLQLNNVAHELQNISNNIQHFQMPVQNTMYTATPSASPTEVETIPEQSIAIAETTPVSEETVMNAENTPIFEEAVASAETAPVVEESVTIAETSPVAEEMLSDNDIASLFEELSSVESIDAIETVEESIASEEIINEKNIEESMITESTIEEAKPEESKSEESKIGEDPNKQLSADEIAALFAAAEPAPNKEPAVNVEEDEKPFTPTFTVVGKSDEYKEEPMTIGDLNEDPNKQLSADEIAALFAAADPAPKREEKSAPEPSITPATEDPNKQLSADEIAALFAAAEPTPKKDPAEEEKMMDEAIANAEPATAPSLLSEDPNKQLSADEIAALFASLG